MRHYEAWNVGSNRTHTERPLPTKAFLSKSQVPCQGLPARPPSDSASAPAPSQRLPPPSQTNDQGDGSELVTRVRRWGSTFGVFEDGSRTEPLWQLQIAHGGRQSFGYQLLNVRKEALQQHPNENVRNPLHLETELRIRVISGAPPQTGHPDPDGVGLEAWRPVIYAPTPADGMGIVEFIMKHKIGAGQVLEMPRLIALFPGKQLTEVPTVRWCSPLTACSCKRSQRSLREADATCSCRWSWPRPPQTKLAYQSFRRPRAARTKKPNNTTWPTARTPSCSLEASTDSASSWTRPTSRAEPFRDRMGQRTSTSGT